MPSDLDKSIEDLRAHCACVSLDSRECMRVRYDLHPDDPDYDEEHCECVCHGEIQALLDDEEEHHATP